MTSYVAKYGPASGDWTHLERISAETDLAAWQQADDLKWDGLDLLKLEGPRLGKDGQRRLIWTLGDDLSQLSAATSPISSDGCDCI